MNAPMDPMSQYDPATEALITGQMSPQHKVAQAMMQQGGGIGGNMAGLSGPLMQLMMSKGMKGKAPMAPGGWDPVMGTGTPPMSPVPVSPMDQASSLSNLRR